MKNNQSEQRAAQRLINSLVAANKSDKPFGYVVSQTNEDNVFKGAASRISFLADSADMVRGVLEAMKVLGYQTGFAVFVNGRAFEVVAVMPEPYIKLPVEI